MTTKTLAVLPRPRLWQSPTTNTTIDLSKITYIRRFDTENDPPDDNYEDDEFYCKVYFDRDMYLEISDVLGTDLIDAWKAYHGL